MSLIPWKQTKRDEFNDFLNFDHPFFGLSLLPSFKSLNADWQTSFSPDLDISDDKDNIYVKADLPGLKKGNIQISVNGTVLTLRGERKYENEEKSKQYYRVERAVGSFQRQIDLGTRVDQAKVKAKYQDGVLKITLPKSEDAKSRDIVVE